MTRFVAFAACLIFFLAGLALVPLLGIQNDEALFAYAVFPPLAGVYILHIGHAAMPLMVMSYVGALKSWIYRLVFAVFGTSVWAVRVPMLLAGAASVWLFYLFMRRVSGERAALIGCGLLAVDASYLLTICFDWGPVALQHLFVVGGLLLVLAFWQHRREWVLAGGFLLFGLAMWDKASAIWNLDAFAIAGLLVFPREILRSITRRRIMLAALAFIAGALPLIAYNLTSEGRTVHDTVSREMGSIGQKAQVLRWTADGSLLFGFLVNGTPPPQVTESRGSLARVSAELASLTGHPRANLMLYAFGLALLLAPLAPGRDRRAITFALAAMAVTWIQMAFTAQAGGSAHHAILLWPLPEMVIGISLAAASRRLGRAAMPVLAAALLILMVSGLAVINEYGVVMARNGGGVNWTDAIYRLSAYLKDVRASEVFCVDWGLMGSLHLLSHGRLPLRVGSEELAKPVWNPEDRGHLGAMVSEPDHVFLTHVAELEVFRGYAARLAEFAETLGFHREMLAVIADGHGRPTFEVYRFVRGASGEGEKSIAPSPRKGSTYR